MAGSSETWLPVIPLLARNRTVVAPDLLGHGDSAKPRGDYSLGALASGIRDLLVALGHDRVTVVGHSLGGGIAMQFIYQFPERAERLALVSSGGLGREVSTLLRLLSLPGSEYLLALGCARQVMTARAKVAGLLTKVGLRPAPALEEIMRSYAALGDAGTRTAFLHTLRSVVDVGGQRVSANDKLYLAAEVPTLIVWGERDPLIPVAHARAAHDALPGSRLELFEDSGHFPHRDDPERFSSLLAAFIDATDPADLSPALLKARLNAGA
jgi:pimeloyl-ACP methyl ester carboxylesterase